VNAADQPRTVPASGTLPVPDASGLSGSVRGEGLNRFDLYELCVQSPAMEAAFVEAVHGGSCRTLGEDFAGPAGIARAWLTRSPDHRAVVADRDDEPLRHAVRKLTAGVSGGEAERLLERFTVRERDVLEVGDRVDAICALNFAACELHTRERLVTYLRHALFRLEPGGVLVLDLYAGPNALVTGESEQVIELDADENQAVGGTGGADGAGDGPALLYRWRQVEADATTARVRNAIDFGVLDRAGRVVAEMPDAFSYDWRLWGVAELREALRDAGFRSTEVYESYAEVMDGSGNLVVQPVSSDVPGAAVGEAEPLDEDRVYCVVGRT
jgi:hypothetical protein